jgi:hypothetical protein
MKSFLCSFQFSTRRRSLVANVQGQHPSLQMATTYGKDMIPSSWLSDDGVSIFPFTFS